MLGFARNIVFYGHTFHCGEKQEKQARLHDGCEYGRKQSRALEHSSTQTLTEVSRSFVVCRVLLLCSVEPLCAVEPRAQCN